jgi:hypothetical protein
MILQPLRYFGKTDFRAGDTRVRQDMNQGINYCCIKNLPPLAGLSCLCQLFHNINVESTSFAMQEVSLPG